MRALVLYHSISRLKVGVRLGRIAQSHRRVTMLRTSLARFARVATDAAFPICEAGALAPARWVVDQQSSQLFVSTPGSCRGFASEPAAADSVDVSTIGNAKVQKLADEIVGLTVLESSWLTEILRKKLNLSKPAYGAMAMAPMGAMPAAAPAAGAPAAEAAKPVEKKEKTEFDVKLESFTAEGKIKVIKEIRAITSLGLKEAKELVRAMRVPHAHMDMPCMHTTHTSWWWCCGNDIKARLHCTEQLSIYCTATGLVYVCIAGGKYNFMGLTAHHHWLVLMRVQVEKAPIVIKAGVSKADADNFKKLIEAGALNSGSR